MLQQLKKFFDEKGQGIVEYALILAFVVAIGVALTTGGLKDSIQGLFSDTATAIESKGDEFNGTGSGGGGGGGE